ncbi:hypothetical protein ACIQXD_32885 [Streptomyces uncialis]|uniref:hypothetical protein n=1 Tax=Streptomyces uncialis TaxID=1048205 RepID=UPI0037F36E70
MHLRCETALDGLRNRHGTIIDAHAAAEAVAKRNHAASEIYRTTLMQHTGTLLTAARGALDSLPPARHHAGWAARLDNLEHAADQIQQILTSSPGEPDGETARSRGEAMWPFLVTWAEHASTACDLADQQHTPAATALSGDELRKWTQIARAARSSGRLTPYESWYDADQRLITIADLQHEDETFTAVALAGDLDSPDVQVLGHYGDELEAIDASPPPVPPGVLHPAASRYAERAHSAEVSFQVLIQDVREARRASDVAEAIETAVDRYGLARGQLVRLEEFVSVCAEFAQALGTQHAQRVAGRLGALSRQFAVLTAELREAGDDLSSTVAVLPPHRTPLAHRPPGLGHPAIPTTLPVTAPPATTLAHRR